MSLDLLLVHPGTAHETYGHLAKGDLIAVEPPLWCRLIAGCILDYGYDVRIIDAEAEQKAPSTVALDAFALRPRLVCIVAYGHQPSASTQQMDTVYEIAWQIRSVSTAKILVVGGHVSALPERTLRECDAIDFVCVGEGPVTVVELLRSEMKDNLDTVAGLVWRGPYGLTINQSSPLIENLSKLHGDVWHKLPMHKYRSHNWQCLDDPSARQPYASIYTSLGCPFSCAFCCINAPFQSHRYRMRDPEEVVEEIHQLHKRHGVKTFKITDEMFVLNERHYMEICNRLIQRHINYDGDLNIWAYARVDTIKPDTLALMRIAGIRWLALGIESASAYVRDGAQKRFKREDIAEVVSMIQDAGINVIANYIFGLPDDDMESMQATLQMAIDLNTEWANFYVAQSYPGSPLYDMAMREGWKQPETWGGYSQHSYYTRPLNTKHVDAASVLHFRDEAFHIYFSTPKFIDNTSHKFGSGAVTAVREMAQRALPRRILEETFAPRERTSSH